MLNKSVDSDVNFVNIDIVIVKYMRYPFKPLLFVPRLFLPIS